MPAILEVNFYTFGQHAETKNDGLIYLLSAAEAKVQFCQGNCILYGAVVTSSIFTRDIIMTEIINSILYVGQIAQNRTYRPVTVLGVSSALFSLSLSS
jgi:hypothetical protein